MEDFIHQAPSVLEAPVYPYPQPAVQKKKWEFQPHDAFFALLALLLGQLFARYALLYADGFFTTGCFLLLYLVSAIYIRKSGCKPRPMQHVLGAVICVFTLVFSLTASELLHGLCFVFLIAAIVWRTHAVCGGKGFVTRFFPIDLADSLLAKPVSHLSAAPHAITATPKKNSAATAVKTIVIGLLVTIPLTIAVAALLASADSAIADLFAFLGDLPAIDTIRFFWQIVSGIPIGLWLFAVLYSSAKRKEIPFRSDEDYIEKFNGLRVIPNLGLYAGVTPICLLYLLYVFTQTNYFLSAFAGRLPEGMLYSEYARRGFFELCAIAVINLIVILVLTGCAKKSGENRPKALTFYAVLLCCFTLFIIATALAKMFLYIHAYGMTQLRVYTTWFMILLAAVFLILLVRQFAAKLPTAAILSGVFTVMFAGLCFGRPDALIAEYNLSRYAAGTLQDPDLNMLCGLSEDAYNVIARYQDILERDGIWEVYYNKAKDKVTVDYPYDKDRSWNLPAQILIQQIHTDTTR